MYNNIIIDKLDISYETSSTLCLICTIIDTVFHILL